MHELLSSIKGDNALVSIFVLVMFVKECDTLFNSAYCYNIKL